MAKPDCPGRDVLVLYTAWKNEAMIVAIHQPECMPWLGFFNKMKQANMYIVFDHVQFKRRYFENRNRICCSGEPAWLTVPVKSKKKFVQPIMVVAIDHSTAWQRKFREKIRHCYGGSKYFDLYFPEIEKIVMADGYDRLIDFNMAMINFFREVFAITTPMKFSSALKVENYKGSDLILEICKRVSASQYLCGASGKDYLKLEDFQQAGIEIIWQDFEHPQYPQTSDTFIPYLSALDLVFNCGENLEGFI